MKNTLKLALVVASALAVTASTQAAYNGDLLVGFTGGSSDFIYDLGLRTGLTSGETWTLGASLGTEFGVVASLNSGSHVWSTSFDSAENGYVPAANFTTVRANVGTIAGSLTSGTSRTTTSADTTGWTYQTAQPPGTPGNTLQNNWFNPNVAVGSTAYFFNNVDTATPSVTADGFFTYDSVGGVLTYTAQAVPEPSTYGLLAGMGLLVVSLRRRLLKA